ncbi:MAG TPA: NAD kinase [Jatrophihabitans sp.]|jgi:NAD+ kinase
MSSSTRSILLVVHPGREQIVALVEDAAKRLIDAGFEVRMQPGEAALAGGAAVTVLPGERAAEGVELVLALGGDGTFLRAAEPARAAGAPMLGVNLGHVGFLAEAEPHALAETIDAIVNRQYTVEQRVTVEAEVHLGTRIVGSAWALNEVSVERTNRERMLDVAVAVDGRPLLRFGCDGVLCATPTGSTAYAFSVGGPILWPNVDAMLIVPNAAHALFARPIVVAPTSTVQIDLLGTEHEAVLTCDGRRSVSLPAGAQVYVRRGAAPVRIARPHDGWDFADRLVSKFQLPVRSFREATSPPDQIG